MIEKAKTLLKKNEGCVLTPYKCTAGKNTIGIGHNLLARGVSSAILEMMLEDGISDRVAEALLDEDLVDVLESLRSLSYFAAQPEYVRIVMIDMTFQMGFRGLLKFKNMLKYIQLNQYDLAAHELLDSRYAVQTKNRANNNARILRTGEL